MKRLLLLLSVLLASQSVMANEARIATMGKSDAFFMDEMSIFRSPGNVSLYSNMLIGDFGNYMDSDTSNKDTYQLKNEDPSNPWFSAIVGLGGKGEDNNGMFSLGLAVNRVDRYDTLYFNKYNGLSDIAKYRPQMPVDVFVGYNLGEVKLGARGHLSMGKWSKDFNDNQTQDIEKSSTIARGSIGARFNVGDGNELEVAAGGNLAIIDNDSSMGNVGDKAIGYSGLARMFMQISPSTDIVISAEYDKFKYTDSDEVSELNAGVGFNFLIDRGFLWAGVSGRSYNTLFTTGIPDQTITAAVLNFGIERNVWWDWFVMRLGGNKVFGEKETKYSNSSTETIMYTNADATKMPDDAIGFGIGLNIEDKLRFDAVVAEDILHTGTNLMSGNVHHIFTKLSGTLSF